MRTFKIITFGCRVNQAESRMIGEQLVANGLNQEKNNPDLVIINSCAVTKKAEKEIRQTIRKIKKENPTCFLVVMGCWLEALKIKKEKTKVLKLVDLLLDNRQKRELIDYFKKKTEKTKLTSPFSLLKIRIINSRSCVNYSTFEDKYFVHKRAMVKIQDGCNNFCSYCLVPYLRGRSVSRKAEEIIEEIENLVKRGIKEVVLTGIDVADFKFESQDKKIKAMIKKLKLEKIKNSLVKLISLILIIAKVEKISFGSINLNAFDKEFIKFVKSEPRITSHFHIPLQSGCNATLKRMARKYTTEEFLRIIRVLNKTIPNFSFSTDIIVGFPGETEQEFSQSLQTIGKIKKILGKKLTHIHIFRYSARPATLAYKMEEKWGKVKEEVKRERSRMIAKLIKS